MSTVKWKELVMKEDEQLENEMISNSQVETFAYNIYRDIAEYIKSNFEDFIWWNLEDISNNCILTIDGILIRENNYDLYEY